MPDLPRAGAGRALRPGATRTGTSRGPSCCVTVLAVLLMFLRPGAREPAESRGRRRRRRASGWKRSCAARAARAAERGPNLVALAAWALRGTLMTPLCAEASPRRLRARRRAGRRDLGNGHVVRAGAARPRSWARCPQGRRVTGTGSSGAWRERCSVTASAGRKRRATCSSGSSPTGSRSPRPSAQFAGVLGAAVASTAPLWRPRRWPSTLYFGFEPGYLERKRARAWTSRARFRAPARARCSCSSPRATSSTTWSRSR